MQTAPRYLTTAELEEGLAVVLASPRDEGQLAGIVIRPESNERERLTTAQVTPAGGLEGDRWAQRGHYKRPDGTPDPKNQISLMNVRILRQLAGSEAACALSGDNLQVDLDLSEANLPAGTQLAIGDEAVLEITPQPHTGCEKFSTRYGKESRAFLNDRRGMELHLRGRFARVVTGGTIRVGDKICKLVVA